MLHDLRKPMRLYMMLWRRRFSLGIEGGAQSLPVAHTLQYKARLIYLHLCKKLQGSVPSVGVSRYDRRYAALYFSAPVQVNRTSLQSTKTKIVSTLAGSCSTKVPAGYTRHHGR
ncbi:unnamed protein product [Ixodes pacificus]